MRVVELSKRVFSHSGEGMLFKEWDIIKTQQHGLLYAVLFAAERVEQIFKYIVRNKISYVHF